MSEAFGLPKAKILGETLDEATAKFLLTNKSPSRKVNELDNRGSQYFLTKYWAKALSTQNDDAKLKATFTEIFETLKSSQELILQELLNAQGSPVDIGGYYEPNDELAEAAMRPSATLNGIIGSI